MKKLLLNGMLSFAFCGLVASCTQSEQNDVIPTEVKEVKLTTHLVAGSRAAMSQDDLDLYYTVYNSSTGAIVEKNTAKLQNLSAEGETSVTLTLQLEPTSSYDIAFWAQPKEVKCYDASNLKAIKINYNHATCNHACNAYYGNVFDLRASQQKEVTVSLKSPFCKVEVLTTTEDVAAASALGYDINEMKSSMTVKGAATTFNALYGIAEGEKANVCLQPGNIPGNIQHIEGKSYQVLASDYVLGFQGHPAEVEVELSHNDLQKEPLRFTAGRAWLEYEETYSLYDHYLTQPVDFNVKVDGSIDSDINQ